MKKITSTLIIICLATLCSFSQKAKINEAWKYYSGQEYDKAKTAIDEAVANEATMKSDKAWYYRGLIYQGMYSDPKYSNLCNKCLETSYESFQKALEVNPKNEWADEIKALRMSLLMRDFFGKGVEQFQKQDYKGALESFEWAQKIQPNDTSSVVNSAFSADRAGDYEKAKFYYNKLLGMGMKTDKIYLALSNVYKLQHDTIQALNTLREGRKLYPDTLTLVYAEINLLLASGKSQQVIDALESATKKDPQNQNLYAALGNTYDRLANPKDATGNDLPKPFNYSDYMIKAEQSYQRGLAINPNNYEINFNLGALFFNQAADLANAASKIKGDKEFQEAKVKYEQRFHDAQPYLEKAMNLNPRKTSDDEYTYHATLVSLKELYARTNQMDKYAEVKALLEKK